MRYFSYFIHIELYSTINSLKNDYFIDFTAYARRRNGPIFQPILYTSGHRDLKYRM